MFLSSVQELYQGLGGSLWNPSRGQQHGQHQVWWWLMLSVPVIAASGRDTVPALMLLLDQGLFWEAVGSEASPLPLMELFEGSREMLGDVCVLRFCPATKLPSGNFHVLNSCG